MEFNGNEKRILNCGIIHTSKERKDHERLAEIRSDLEEIIQSFKPNFMSVEKIFFFKNPKTIIPVAQARGVILELAGSHKIDLYEYTPLQVKQIITGHGRAEKSTVLEFVKNEFNLKENIKPDDAVDAVAIALSFLRADYLKLEAQSA